MGEAALAAPGPARAATFEEAGRDGVGGAGSGSGPESLAAARPPAEGSTWMRASPLPSQPKPPGGVCRAAAACRGAARPAVIRVCAVFGITSNTLVRSGQSLSGPAAAWNHFRHF